MVDDGERRSMAPTRTHGAVATARDRAPRTGCEGRPLGLCPTRGGYERPGRDARLEVVDAVTAAAVGQTGASKREPARVRYGYRLRF